MFGTFRKHSTWLWSIIIGATAVSMVIYFGPGNRSASDSFGGGNNLGFIAGEPVTQEALRNAAAEARLQFFSTRGEWPGNDAAQLGFDLNVEAYKRLFIVQKQKELGIYVSDDQVTKVAAENLRLMSRNGQNVSMAIFEKNVLNPGGVTLIDYQRFLRHQLGLQQLVAAVTVGGKLVTEKEARAIFERENRERSVQAVFFSTSNYLAGVTSTPETLLNFYSNYVARYRLPDRLQVAYVEFKATNYWDEAAAELEKMTNLTALLEGEYNRRGTNFYADKTPEQAKEEIKNELHAQLALRAASRRANEFADPILSAKEIRAAALAERAKELNVPVHISNPFDRSSAPEEMDVSDPFVKAAFGLNDYDPVGGPVIDGDAIYLMVKHKEIPSAVRTYDEVKDEVASDYQQSEALRAARDAANQFVAIATNGLAQGKPFAGICSEANVSPVLLPPFSLSTRSLPEVEEHMSLQQFKQIAFTIKVGDVSPAVSTMEGSVVAYIQSVLELDQEKVEADLPAFLEMFRQARQQEAFDEWFNKEALRALANTPVVGPRPSELNDAEAVN